MAGHFSYTSKLPTISDFDLEAYIVGFSLDRLVPGVDNIRHDVLISPTFITATRKIVTQLVKRHAGIEKRKPNRQNISWAKEVESYKQLYKEIMRDALNKAKGLREPQVECLAQAAMVKLLLGEIRSQYDHLVGSLKKTARKSDLALHNDSDEAPKLKNKLQLILQGREALLQRVGEEICGFWIEMERKEIQQMREAIFGNRSTFFVDLLGTAMLHLENAESELFVLLAYDVALGRRIEDPDRYDRLLYFIRRLIGTIDAADASGNRLPVDKRATPDMDGPEPDEEEQKAYARKIEAILLRFENMDRLFNWQRTKAELQQLRKKRADAKEISRLKRLVKNQKLLLNYFYKHFVKKGLIGRISAAYEMQPEYLEYCPPLNPQQIMQYLALPKARRAVKHRLKRLSTVYGRPFSLSPLNKKIKSMEQITTAKRKAYLIRFLNAFAHYHRDVSNCDIIKEGIQRVQIATEEKVVTLSRENNTLYEFLLPNEQESSQKPIINHVVIKADVRGSTDLTHRMIERGLNPASYFSLNFFDPISEILNEYDAAKVFIEGDAVILSIFERADTPSDWYGVARACGLAINMLIIIQRYNEKSRKHELPVLELGVGISYLEKAPTFLFDGNNRIMISSAINHADRLSSCSKTMRSALAQKKGPFRLYVFQSRSDEEIAATADDLSIRYNVNGIELNAQGFEKLSKEIDLKMLPGNFNNSKDQTYTLYLGKFPTKSGRYQRLIIREAQIPVVEPTSLKPIRFTSRKYYEVCTNPSLYKWVRKAES